jgi:hypothetical protein
MPHGTNKVIESRKGVVCSSFCLAIHRKFVQHGSRIVPGIPVRDIDMAILGDDVHRVVHDGNRNCPPKIDSKCAIVGLLNEKDLNIIKQQQQNGATREREAPKFDCTA